MSTQTNPNPHRPFSDPDRPHRPFLPHTTPRITFAPLPLIEPRNRRSQTQIKLGVASRSNLMRQQRMAIEKLDHHGKSRIQPAREEEGGEGEGEGWNDTLKKPPRRDLERALKKVPPGGDIWQNDKIPNPTRSTDSDIAFLSMGRLVKSAWKRVSQSQIRTPSPSTPPNKSPGSGDVKIVKELDVLEKLSSETETITLEKQRGHGHDDEGVSGKRVCSVAEDVLGNVPIRLKFKKPVLLVRSASEPIRKSTIMTSTFKAR